MVRDQFNTIYYIIAGARHPLERGIYLVKVLIRKDLWNGRQTSGHTSPASIRLVPVITSTRIYMDL